MLLVLRVHLLLLLLLLLARHVLVVLLFLCTPVRAKAVIGKGLL